VSSPTETGHRAPVRPALSKPQPSARPARPLHLDLFGWAVPIYMLLISGGFAFLRSPLATARGNELSIDRAAFSVINAITLSGFQQSIGGANELLVPGQLGIATLMTAGTALSLLIGAMLVERICNLHISDRQILLSCGGGLLVAMLLGAASLGDTPLHGAFMGISALGNCGLFLGKLPSPTDLSAMIVLLPLTIAGGVGAIIWIELIRGFVRRLPLSRFAMIALSTYGLAYLLGTALLLPQLSWHDSFAAALAGASSGSIAARSAGFALLPLDQFSRPGQWIIAALMVLGPVSGAAGGGLKCTTIYVLYRSLRRSYFGRPVGRSLAIAAVWIATYAVIVFAGFLMLLWCAPQLPGDRALFLVISAVSNVGLSHEPVSLVKASLATLCALMLLGRAMPLLVLWWASKKGDGEVAIG
jgi:hypothetical protein